MYHHFSIADTIKASWRVLKKNIVPLVVYSAITLFINELMEFFKDFIFIGDDRISTAVIWLLQMIIQSYLTLSFYKLILTLIDKEYYEFSFKDILPSFRMTFNFILIALAYVLLIAILLFFYVVLERVASNYVLQLFKALELCLILYLMLRCIFCVCFIIDDDSSPFESLKQSFEITKDNFFNTLAMFLIILAFMVIVLIPIFIIFILCGFNEDSSFFAQKLMFYCWFILAFPAVQVMIMETYRKLVYSHQDIDDDVSETD
jgi:hypothetical protein